MKHHTQDLSRRTLAAVVVTAAALGLGFAANAVAAPAKSDPSAYERARNATIRAAKTTDAALERAADRTERWLRDKQAVLTSETKPKTQGPGPRPGT